MKKIERKTFFKKDDAFKKSPFFTTAKGDDELRLAFHLQDYSGTFALPCTAWRTVVTDLLGISVSDFRSAWESCEDPEKHDAYVACLNQHVGKTFKFMCTVRVQTWQGKEIWKSTNHGIM